MVGSPNVSSQEDLTMFYLGIDQHRKQLTVCLRSEEGEVTLKQQVSTQWDRVKGFLTELQGSCAAQGGYVAVVEVCGFNDWLLELLPQYGCREVVLIQPEERQKRKTDRRDANRLSELLWVNRQRLLAGQRVQGLRRVHIPSPQDRQDRQRCALRKRLGAQRTRVKNQVQHLLRKHNLQQECPTKGSDTRRARVWLKQLELPPLDRWEMDQALAHWEALDKAVEAVELQIGQRLSQRPDARCIATVFGSGGYAGLALAASIGSIERFPRPRSLANYWGLTPGCRNSGEATDRLGSITKQGSPLARFLLAQRVVHVLRRDPTMRQWFRRIKQRRGSKIARVAVMRRLATIIWHMLKEERPYESGRRPTTPSELARA
jgi:transposase